jgi:hypothetical protein
MAERKPQLLIPLVLALGLLGIFGYVAVMLVGTSGQAPRLADVAPTAPPSLAPGGKDYPPQYRGGFDENARLLGLIAIVSPLLTTIVGFYFGQHAGEANARAAKAQANEQVAQIQSIASEDPRKPTEDFMKDLKTRGVLKGITI